MTTSTIRTATSTLNMQLASARTALARERAEIDQKIKALDVLLGGQIVKETAADKIEAFVRPPHNRAVLNLIKKSVPENHVPSAWRNTGLTDEIRAVMKSRNTAIGSQELFVVVRHRFPDVDRSTISAILAHCYRQGEFARTGLKGSYRYKLVQRPSSVKVATA